jgi:hypothetical protein
MCQKINTTFIYFKDKDKLSADYKLSYVQNAKHKCFSKKHDSLPAEKKLEGFMEIFSHFSVSL